jgi:cytochrome c5
VSRADDIFIKNFLAVLGALVLFTILAFFLARGIGISALEQIQNSPKAVSTRVSPVGRVRVLAPGEEPPQVAPQSAVTAAAPPAEATAKTGEEVYSAACVACHAAGVAGAPKLGDQEAWFARSKQQGLAGLVQSVINGKNAMPARAGNPELTDEDIERAVEYMLEKSGVTAG